MTSSIAGVLRLWPDRTEISIFLSFCPSLPPSVSSQVFEIEVSVRHSSDSPPPPSSLARSSVCLSFPSLSLSSSLSLFLFRILRTTLTPYQPLSLQPLPFLYLRCMHSLSLCLSPSLSSLFPHNFSSPCEKNTELFLVSIQFKQALPPPLTPSYWQLSITKHKTTLASWKKNTVFIVSNCLSLSFCTFSRARVRRSKASVCQVTGLMMSSAAAARVRCHTAAM